VVSKYLGHFPEGLVEFHILIDALDCPALGHPATVRAAAGTVALTPANDVFLDTVQSGPKIFGSVSITSWIKELGGTYRGFREVFPAISRRASGQSLANNKTGCRTRHFKARGSRAFRWLLIFLEYKLLLI
jgi:hypothetical protein